MYFDIGISKNSSIQCAELWRVNHYDGEKIKSLKESERLLLNRWDKLVRIYPVRLKIGTDSKLEIFTEEPTLFKKSLIDRISPTRVDIEGVAEAFNGLNLDERKKKIDDIIPLVKKEVSEKTAGELWKVIEQVSFTLPQG